MKIIRLTILFLIISALFSYLPSEAQEKNITQPVSIESAHPGQVLMINGRQITVLEKDITPVIENAFSKRGTYESAENPKLKQLRKQEGFDKMMEGSKDEFEQMQRIADWAQKRLPKFGTPTSKALAPIDIIKAADEGNTFFCNHFACIFVGASASMGWPSRTLALHVGNHPSGKGAPEHSVAEVWSNQYRKWVLFDPLYGAHFEMDEIPLNAWEMRQAWFYGDRNKIMFVMGVNGKAHKYSELPIPIKEQPGDGLLSLGTRTIDKLALIGYVPGNNVINYGSLNYSDMFISTDTLASNIKWHKRINPKDPAVDSYFPVNQADLKFTAVPGGLKVDIRTNTPNFAKFRYRINEGKWMDGEPDIWKLKNGRNSIEVKPVNTFGVEGVISRVVLNRA